MIGRVRLNHLQQCVERVLEQNIPGDLLEAGVWRGGACILMRAVLKAFEDRRRVVWLADSFEGMPKYSGCGEDRGDTHWKHNDVLSVSLSEVKAAFLRYGKAVDEYRRSGGIVTPMQAIDWTGIFWQKLD